MYDVFLFQAIPYHLESMDFGTEIDGTQDFFQMFWPIIVSHKIDEESPLWEMSAIDLTSKMQFEVVLTMEGITPETGNTIQLFRQLFSYETNQYLILLINRCELHTCLMKFFGDIDSSILVFPMTRRNPSMPCPSPT